MNLTFRKKPLHALSTFFPHVMTSEAWVYEDTFSNLALVPYVNEEEKRKKKVREKTAQKNSLILTANFFLSEFRKDFTIFSRSHNKAIMIMH